MYSHVYDFTQAYIYIYTHTQCRFSLNIHMQLQTHMDTSAVHEKHHTKVVSICVVFMYVTDVSRSIPCTGVWLFIRLPAVSPSLVRACARDVEEVAGDAERSRSSHRCSGVWLFIRSGMLSPTSELQEYPWSLGCAALQCTWRSGIRPWRRTTKGAGVAGWRRGLGAFCLAFSLVVFDRSAPPHSRPQLSST